jgi:hypothetical protein
MQKMDLHYFCTQAGDCGIHPHSIYCIFLLINLLYINEVVRTSKRMHTHHQQQSLFYKISKPYEQFNTVFRKPPTNSYVPTLGLYISI